MTTITIQDILDNGFTMYNSGSMEYFNYMRDSKITESYSNGDVNLFVTIRNGVVDEVRIYKYNAKGKGTLQVNEDYIKPTIALTS